MAYKVIVSIPAKLDIGEHAAFIREQHKSPEMARRWVDGLQAELKKLSFQPSRFSVIAESQELLKEFRSFHYHAHRVIFEVIEDNKQVVVHRVYHGSRDALRDADVPSSEE